MSDNEQQPENEQVTDGDQVLTDEEKEALVEGVENGEVEVQSANGAGYAAVQPFVVSPRNHIVTNSYPRLQGINRKLAGQLGKSVAGLLNDKFQASEGELTTSTWGEFREDKIETALMFEFTASPLQGSAVVYIPRSTVELIVDRFYGGSPENPPRPAAEGFTRGEINVIAIYGREVLKAIEDSWSVIAELNTDTVGVHQSTDVVDIVEDGETVIRAAFALELGDEQFPFKIIWPVATLGPLLPVLEGQKRDRDLEEDRRWGDAIRARVPEAALGLETCVGHSRMSLRQIAKLEVGDVIDLENPHKGTVFTNRVAVLEGRFGVHDGCYAIEATRWLQTDDAANAG